jgi:hypothetical protein
MMYEIDRKQKPTQEPSLLEMVETALNFPTIFLPSSVSYNHLRRIVVLSAWRSFTSISTSVLLIYIQVSVYVRERLQRC